MGFFDELLLEILKPPSPKDQSQDARIESLEKEVAKLRGAIVVLSQVLYENDAFGRVDGDRLRRRFSQALRSVDSFEDTYADRGASSGAEDDLGKTQEGVLPTCASCRKVIAPDDPELFLQNRGRACLACFQRGG